MAKGKEPTLNDRSRIRTRSGQIEKVEKSSLSNEGEDEINKTENTRK